MKTLKTSSNGRRIVVIAFLAATVVTVTMAVIPASIVKPAYAQLDDISNQIGEIPDSDDIKEKAREIIASQPVPTLPELGTALIGPRSPPAYAD
jgi:hypothetical protein